MDGLFYLHGPPWSQMILNTQSWRLTESGNGKRGVSRSNLARCPYYVASVTQDGSNTAVLGTSTGPFALYSLGPFTGKRDTTCDSLGVVVFPEDF